MLDARNEVTHSDSYKTLNPIGIAIHHTASRGNPDMSEDNERSVIRAIDAYHLAQGYGGFGYHAIVFQSGRSYICGDPEKSRAHVAHRNHELIGIAAHGDFTSEKPTPRLLQALTTTIRELDPDGSLTIDGHTQWALPGNGTLCPGDLIQALRDFDASSLISNPNQPPALEVAHALHFAYTGYWRQDKYLLHPRDLDILNRVTRWYNSRT